MRFSEVTNIWSVDLKKLSNADIGLVYYERAKQVVFEALSNPSPKTPLEQAVRFPRWYLSAQIGCCASVLTQNRRIRLLLIEVDDQLRANMRSAPMSRAVREQELLGKIARSEVTIGRLCENLRKQREALSELRKTGGAGSTVASAG